MLKHTFNFQNSSTPIMEGIINLHNYVFFYVILIFIVVTLMLVNIIYQYIISVQVEDKKNIKTALLLRYIFVANSNITHNRAVEIIWTIIPSIILFFIALPSFALLYAIDDIITPALTIKVIGHQWYRSYEYPVFKSVNSFYNDEKSIEFDSYMVAEDNLLEGDFRLFEVDNEVILPSNVHIRILITANDVLHSWAIPSFGIKVDAVPGRINQIGLFIKRQGVFYGQCSELCGVNHGFTPIVIKSCSYENFKNWINFKFSESNFLTIFIV